jgi:hypothetical protein
MPSMRTKIWGITAENLRVTRVQVGYFSAGTLPGSLCLGTNMLFVPHVLPDSFAGFPPTKSSFLPLLEVDSSTLSTGTIKTITKCIHKLLLIGASS